jgi:hypothetical protein
MQASFGYRFFAVVCFCLLVGSVLFPFATRLGFVYSLPPTPLPFDAIKETFWSFMNLREWLSQRQDGYATVNESWSIFYDYWNSSARYLDPIARNRTIHPSSVLALAFILQVVCLLLGIFVVVSEIRIWKSILLLSLMVILDILYLWVAHVFYAELYVGFWLSVLSTVFVLVPMILANMIDRLRRLERARASWSWLSY